MNAGRWPIYVGMAAIVQLLTACSNEPATSNGAVPSAQLQNGAAPIADGKLILAFGDSLYAGYGVAQNESFPYRLEQALRAKGLAAQVHNAGVSGETSLGGMQRLAFTLDGLPRKPDLLLIDLGGNDMLRGLQPEESEKNLRAILDELKRRQIPVLLTGMRAAPNMGAEYGAKFNAIYPRLAKDYDLSLYPFFLDGVIGDAKLMQADSIHPNPAGVNVIVGKITPIVMKSLG
ncbi:arylesterase [Sphingobium chungbukense]|uniref:GDSL family lipase n=1 Tax=Sphingobium chungbukense TaxID=56193 RepID=A0A0M3ATC1_9SPHN|nr:arylesterase [Sphingobium chungbukense]KKW91769.1 GDSL family lipase [Sphingobium chungbukense]